MLGWAAFWALYDERGDGLVSEAGLEGAVYDALAPVVGAVGQVYPTLPPVSSSRAQKKAFAKFLKDYLRDSEDFPTKLRSVLRAHAGSIACKSVWGLGLFSGLSWSGWVCDRRYMLSPLAALPPR
jgi:hypothetical protein